VRLDGYYLCPACGLSYSLTQNARPQAKPETNNTERQLSVRTVGNTHFFCHPQPQGTHEVNQKCKREELTSQRNVRHHDLPRKIRDGLFVQESSLQYTLSGGWVTSCLWGRTGRSAEGMEGKELEVEEHRKMKRNFFT
jgi:hypothetical protein